MKYPEDWKMVTIGTYGRLEKVGVNPSSTPNIMFTEYSMPAYDLGCKPACVLGKTMLSTRNLISGEVLLFNKLNVRKKRVWHVKNCPPNAVASGEFLAYKSDELDLSLLCQILMTDSVTATFDEMSTGTSNSQKRIHPTNFLNFEILLPSSIEEQYQISKVLENADQLIDNLEKRIAKKRAIKQGAMQELLTGKKRLPGFTGEWKMVKLGKLSTIKARIGWQGLTTAEYLTDGEYYLVNGINIEAGKVIWRKCFMVDKKRYNQDKNIQLRKHDVLVSKDGTIGKVAYVTDLPKLATLNSGVFVIRTTDSTILQEYLARIFLSKWFDNFVKKITAGSTIVHLYQKDIVGFSFMVPPTIAEQRAIAKILSDMDDEISILERKLEKVKAVKQGMMQDLLTGKVRLRGQA